MLTRLNLQMNVFENQSSALYLECSVQENGMIHTKKTRNKILFLSFTFVHIYCRTEDYHINRNKPISFGPVVSEIITSDALSAVQRYMSIVLSKYEIQTPRWYKRQPSVQVI